MPGFEIDDRKLKRGLQALPAARTTADDKRDLKMVGALIAAPLILLVSLGLVVASLLSRL